MIDNPIVPTDTETGTGTTFTVTNTRDSGTGSLRQAILDANANPGKDTIAFNIGGGGVQRIEPVSPLPPIADPAIVDGTTQPGFTTSPIIELNGSVAGENASGLLITAGNSTVKGLVINQFSRYGMRLQNLGNNEIQGNYLGTDISGTQALGNGRDGLRIESPNNAIGGTTPEARNLISGNVEYGVFIRSTDEIEATGNQVIGNYIGTDITGTQALSNSRDGAYILEASDNIIGGTTAAAGNLISGNDRGGVRISGIGAIGNEVLGNYIGTDVSGTFALGNATYGILVETSNNTIGGRTEGARNLISGNGEYGVFIRDTEETEATGNEVIGNYIGTDVTGTLAVGNLRDGVYILDAANNIIGGVGTAAGNLLSGNRNGVRILGSSAEGNEVLGNFIGTDANGTAAIANTSSGIRIEAVNNIIGGTIAGARNLISGNIEYGVQIRGTEEIDTTGNQVIGNYIGTDVTGTAAVANTRDGVYIEEGANNTIGGSVEGAKNLISGNNRSGVLIRGSGARSNEVLGNYIGTDVSGSLALSNTSSGVRIEAINNIIGGSTPDAGNLISGNLEYGIQIRSTEENESRENQVIGNYIGTDVTGTIAVGNDRDGVYIEESANNTIGGTSLEARNLISGNNRGGVLIRGSNATENQVLGNYIGTDVTGTAAVGNIRDGARIEASNNIIGGTTLAAGNILAFNGGDGVFVQSGTGNAILSNSILSNSDLAIDLNPGGVTENDAGDSDTGANNLQNFPVLTSVALGEDDSSTIVAGTLNSTPNNTFAIQFFTNNGLDTSGNGEGQTWLGATTVTTDASGNANFTETFEIVISPAQFVTATATDSNNNTSEFSPGRTIASMRNRIIGTPEDDILIGTAGDDAIFAREANDLVNGNLGDDLIAGGPDNDSLTGSLGNDLMFGGSGDDLLDGSAGDDTLIGGLGMDLLVGREGSDLFVLRTSTAVADKFQADVLLSFDPGVDAIGLTAGLTEEDLILERMGTNTVISIARSNLVLGVVSVVLPDQLAGSFVPFDFNRSDE